MYVKLIDNLHIEEAPKNMGSIINFNLDVELMLEYGYKPLEPVGEPPETNRMTHIEYVEEPDKVKEVFVYDETQEEADEREFNTRKKRFEREFFNTSLGYIRRKVTMKTGEIKDFLSDLLPSITIGVNQGLEVKVIAYDMPDFTEDVTDWTEYQHNETVTPQFIQECLLQQSADFGVVNETVEA